MIPTQSPITCRTDNGYKVDSNYTKVCVDKVINSAVPKEQYINLNR